MSTRSSIALIIIILVAVAAYFAFFRAPAPAARTLTNSVSYACSGGKTIDAKYYEGKDTPGTADTPPIPGGSAEITLSDGRTMTLAQTISADGVRYANADESFVFWSKGNGALVLENNEEKSYIGCVLLAPASAELPQAYANGAEGFSLRLPAIAATSTDNAGYRVDESYQYQALGPNKGIGGVRFGIPSSIATGTNLSQDSYLSVEQIPQTADCRATLFLEAGAAAQTVTDNGVEYSFASTTGAAVGNRYLEYVYAIPGTNPCVAVRYFIHYGAIQNYPEGMVREFDLDALLKGFDAIRRTLILNQLPA